MNEQAETTAHVPESWQTSPARRAQLEQHYALRALGRRRQKIIWSIVFGGIIAAFALALCFEVSRPIAPLLLAGVAGFFLWLLPGLIAMHRGHRNATGVWLVTLFLGWTLIGWVVALVWAVYEEKK